VVDAADTTCTQHSDCVLATDQPSCSDGCYDGAAVSAAGQKQIADGSLQLTNGLCATIKSSGCFQPIPPCVAPPPSMPACVAGKCRKAAQCASCPALCLLPFDEGVVGNSLSATVYFHDVSSGACLPRTYQGVGGNANRFATRAECETTCPPPSACPDNRLQSNVCLACGVAGGCMDQRDVCALACTTTADCTDDATGYHTSGCSGGVCIGSIGCL
jgi:hypothetical protein